MRYVLSFLFPPLGPLLCGRMISTLVNMALCVGVLVVGLLTGGMGLVLGIIPLVHAWSVVHGHNADRRTDRVVAAMGRR